MEFFVLGALALGFGLIAFPNESPLPPSTVAALGLESRVVDECAEPLNPNTVDNILEAPRPDRTTGFKLRGSYRCHRPLFATDERDPYIEIAIRSESAKAKRVALDVRRRWSEWNNSINNNKNNEKNNDANESTPTQPPLALAIRAAEAGASLDPRLENAIATLYRTELVALLGPGRVSQRPARGDEKSLLLIRLRRVDVPRLLSEVSLLTQNRQGEDQWLEL